MLSGGGGRQVDPMARVVPDPRTDDTIVGMLRVGCECAHLL